MSNEPPLPPIVSPAEWQVERDRLLVKEKAATRTLDALAAQRRRLPMVRVDKDYTLSGPSGLLPLAEVFGGRRQLIVYHFMFDPTWESPCPGCSRRIDDVGHLAHLHARDTSFVVVSLSPYSRLAALGERKRLDRAVLLIPRQRLQRRHGRHDRRRRTLRPHSVLRDNANNVSAPTTQPTAAWSPQGSATSST